MGMHRSEELREVVAVLYEQMIPLGFATLGCELILCDEQNEQLQYWSATPEQAQLPELSYSKNHSSILSTTVASLEKKNTSFSSYP